MKRMNFGSAVLAALIAMPCVAAAKEPLEVKLERMEREIQELKQELRKQKESAPATVAAPAPTPAAAPVVAAQPSVSPVANPPAATNAVTQFGREVVDRVKLGGYGSMRYEGSSLKEQKHTFTLRRLVLTVDANIAPRLHSYVELEFERFRKLEVEKTLRSSDGGVKSEIGIESTNNSEISLEQAWMQYDIADWLKYRGGAVLVPLGRFNINHDDNRWDLPRRSLVDRGVSVLPSTAAWDELGMGFLGDIHLTDDADLGYQIYVVNGVALDTEIETVTQSATANGDRPVSLTEVKITPSTGGFAADVKDSKAVTGRLAFSPALGHEIAGSWYYGQYTPDFLGKQDLWSLALDGRTGKGPFELEGQWVFTRFEGTRQVAQSLARYAVDKSSGSSDPGLSSEIEFNLANLARNRYGYWLEARYRFWPAILNETFLGRSFANPQLVGVLRGEQVWLDDLVDEVGFEGTQLTDFNAQNRRVDRFTFGMAYRPVPLVAFQLAYEYTQTNAGQSLSNVTNFLPAQSGEDNAHIVMIGSAFGF